MRNKVLFAFVLIILTAALTGTVCAQDLYNITVSQGESFTDTAEYWYVDLNAPKVSGMADTEEEADLNAYFLETLDIIKEDYEEDIDYVLESFEGEDGPRFGYEYKWAVVYENDDNLVFKTWLYYAAGSTMTVNEYWTLDKHSGEVVQLDRLVDDEQLEEIRGMILDAMKERNETEEIYWVDEEDFNNTFSFVGAYQHWYVNENGNLVFTFDKYEIAPGAYGSSEFEIVDGKAVLIEEAQNVFDLYVGSAWSEDEGDWSIDVKIPVLNGLADKSVEDEINQHFAEVAENVRGEYEELASAAEESKEDGNGPHFSYSYGYEVITDSDDYFVFKTEVIFIAGSLSNSAEYWNLDKNTRSLIALSDLIPEKSMDSVYDQIYAEMKEANESGEGGYFIDDEWGTLQLAVSSLEENRHWYLNSDGEIIAAFDKYEVAPGVMGTPEFVIEP